MNLVDKYLNDHPLWYGQKRVFEAFREEKVVTAFMAQRLGKTHLVAMCAIDSFLDPEPPFGKTIVLTAPTSRMARQILLSEVILILNKMGLEEEFHFRSAGAGCIAYGKMQERKIVAVGASAQHLQGFINERVEYYVDEAGGITDEYACAILKGAYSLLAVGSPKGGSRSLLDKVRKRSESHFHYTAFSSPNLNLLEDPDFKSDFPWFINMERVKSIARQHGVDSKFYKERILAEGL